LPSSKLAMSKPSTPMHAAFRRGTEHDSADVIDGPQRWPSNL
jgi:hypothetical protein